MEADPQVASRNRLQKESHSILFVPTIIARVLHTGTLFNLFGMRGRCGRCSIQSVDLGIPGTDFDGFNTSTVLYIML
jgi:hypothetical protein